MSNFYVYVYTCSVKNVPIYVGKGKDSRAFAHFTAKTRLGNHLRKRVSEGKTKESLYPFIIDCQSEQAALDLEVQLIKHYGREDLGLGTLFNLNDGGTGIVGHRHTAEHKKKIGDSRRGEKRAYFEHPNQKGLKHTVEAKAKMSASLTGKKYPNRKAVVWSEESKLNQSKKMGKTCTVDGVTFFHSRNMLVKALGWGKEGYGHPNFRWVS